jgi:DNA processing protein
MTKNDTPALGAISPRHELGAYEALWLEKGATFKTIAEKFAADPAALPSDFVPPARADECASEVMRALKAAGVHRFGVRVNHAGDYPPRLRDARHPVELLYYQGAWELTETRSVAVVGTRKPSDDGIERADRLARELVSRGFTVVSGLAAGIDTAAHTAPSPRRGRRSPSSALRSALTTRRKIANYRIRSRATFCSYRRCPCCVMASKLSRKTTCSSPSATSP